MIGRFIGWLIADQDKGGQNSWPSQIVERPAPPTPMRGGA